ncbi:MAG: mechanosensitive ion channel [Gammaproteobacteria bacterium]|nr:mechanosensitive ion channel [Gammaproteobacteria bacterium]
MKNLIRILVALWLALGSLPAQGQTPALDLVTGKGAAASKDQRPSEVELRELIRLLGNPALVERLRQRLPETALQQADDSLSVSGLQQHFQEILNHVKIGSGDLVHALIKLPQLYQAISAAWNKNMAASNFLKSAIYVVIFLFGGFGLEWLYWTYLSTTLTRIELSKPKSYGSVLKAAALRAVLLFGSIAVFAFGSVGLFLAFEWSPFIDHIVLSLLAGIIGMRFVVMIAVFVLAPKVDDLRLMPFDKAAAKNIYTWILAISAVGLLGYLSVGIIDRMAVSAPSLLAIESLVGLLFATVLVAAFWQSYSMRRRVSGAIGAGDAVVGGAPLPVPGNFKLVLSSVLVLVGFILWVLGINAVLWTLVTLAVLFPAISLSHVMVEHIFDNLEYQAPEAATPNETQEVIRLRGLPNRYQIYRPIADRLIRFLLVIVAVLTLGMVWDVNSMLQSSSNLLAANVFGIIIDVVFALLIADFVWTWAKTAIERKIASFPPIVPGHPPGPEARMATLLPMIKMVLMITIIIMVSLIVLSSLGVNIGPILAGAGVVGIALGFGAQALVKDIFSGVFFLIDDAFRVGEYIEMGELRGTVEGVSIRSLRVRHHRGALHTIPYGELKSLTNYSRDWVIMKLEFRVPFDTDVKLFKRIVKKVGAKLQANEDYGHHIIEPLKSQGVRRMEEFNMVLGVKFMAVPGEQWTIRRDTYQQIRDEFDKNGIKFAARDVQVKVVSDRPLTKQEEEQAAASAVQESIEKQGPAIPPPDEP